MDYKHEFSDLETDKESIDYINNYKESLKSYPNLLKRIRPEIFNLSTVGEIGIYLFENVFYSDTSKYPSLSELKYMFQIVYQIPPYASIKRTQIIQELRHYFESISRTKDLWY